MVDNEGTKKSSLSSDPYTGRNQLRKQRVVMIDADDTNDTWWLWSQESIYTNPFQVSQLYRSFFQLLLLLFGKFIQVICAGFLLPQLLLTLIKLGFQLRHLSKQQYR